MAPREDVSQSPNGLIKVKLVVYAAYVGLELFIIWNGATAHHHLPYNKADLLAVSNTPGK